jgi:hypothetical protein
MDVSPTAAARTIPATSTVESGNLLIRGAGLTAVAAVLFPRLNAVLHEGEAIWQLDTEAAVLIPIVVAVTLALFATVGRWACRESARNRPASVGLGFGIAAIVGVIAFWISAPIIFGGVALTLGIEGGRRTAVLGRGRLARAAVILGAIAVVGGAAIWLIGN